MSRKDLRPVSLIKKAATGPQDAGQIPAGADAPEPAGATAATPVILVLGMHRSGTSAITRTLNLLGAAVPDNLIPPNPEANAAGFWESEDLRVLHDELLASAASSWDDWLPFNPGWYRSAAAEPFRQRARGLLERYFRGAVLYVIKDPRICRFLPFWLDVLTEVGVQPHCVLMTRDPLEVAASLRRRDGFSRSKSLMLWLRHVLDAEFASRDLPRAFASYDQLLHDWRAVAAGIGQRLGMEWPRLNPATEAQIDAFLDPEQRHHEVALDAGSQGETVAEWVRSAQAALRVLHRGGDEADAHQKLDCLRAECDRASQLLGALLWSEAERHGQELTQREHELDQVRAAIAEQKQQQQGLHSVLLERDRELADRLAANRELQRVSQELEQRLSIRDAYVDELASTIDALNDRIRALEATLAERNAETESLNATLAERNAEIESLNAGIDALGGVERERLRTAALLNEELTQLRAQRRDLAARLNHHQTRLSWQAARPLLWVEQKAPWLLATAAGSAKTLAWSVTGQLPYRMSLRRQAEEISAAGLFDEAWYVGEHPEVLHSGYRPLYHWLVQGATQAWSPHPLFDTPWYLQHSAAVGRPECNPLRHYLRHGDGCSPHPLFDPTWYASQCPTADRAETPALVHYLRHGVALRLDPHPLFDTNWYLRRYPHVAAAADNPLAHYVRQGADEGTDPSPSFHTQSYREQNPGACACAGGVNPLVHFLRHHPAAAAELATQRAESGPGSAAETEVLTVPGWSGDWSSVAPPASADSGWVLIIDQHPPTADRDSGSVRMMKIISGLVDAGVQVCFIGDGPVAGERYRQALEHLGVMLLVGREAALGHLSAQGPHYRAVILSRPETVESYLPLVRAFAFNAKVIYDTVDLHWVRFARGAELSGDREMGQRADHYRRLELANARAVDLTLVVSDSERRLLHEQVPELAVEVLSNIHEIADQVPGFEQRRDLFFIGGFEHAPNLDAMLYFVAEVLPLIAVQIPTIRLLIAGSEMPDQIRELASDRVDILGHVPEVTPLLKLARIFVAPLRYGAGVKGKVGQSMGAGLPVVTTGVGAEGLGLEDRRHALIADDAEAFAAAVILLYNDAQLWQRLSGSGRALIAAGFSEPAVRDRLLSIVGHGTAPRPSDP